MKVLQVRNVNDALKMGLEHLERTGCGETSRNGPVLVAPTPVTTVFTRPQERVLFSRLRDANPFFHLMEPIWMLAGRRDVEFPARYASRLGEFSDDGVSLNGSAYGYRWRQWFNYDQLSVIVAELRRNPASRRCVLAMWDGRDAGEDGGYNAYAGDLKAAVNGSKDVPCNTHIYFRIMEGCLDMTVCNRSNDVVWGAYGANAVHFSFLQEFLAAAIGVRLGYYYQISNNYHIYTDRDDVVRLLKGAYVPDDLYQQGLARFYPILDNSRDALQFLLDCETFCAGAYLDVQLPFFKEVAIPMARAHSAYKAGEHAEAWRQLQECRADDWRKAGQRWFENRKNWRVEGSAT